jgi:hypothetical protein
VYLEASTKPHVHQKIEIFWTNIAPTMGCPNSKNRPKKGLRPLGVKKCLRKLNPSSNCMPISAKGIYEIKSDTPKLSLC